jgi:uncharacterized iron-regulated membrane protein
VTIKKALLKYAYRLHTYVGIFVALHFVLFALTGLVLLFQDEFQNAPVVAAKTPAQTHQELATNYANILTDLQKNFSSDRVLAFFPDEKNPQTLHVRLGLEGSSKLRGARRATYDLITAAPKAEAPVTGAGFFDWVLQLHRELFLGSTGKLYVGFIGLLYAFVLVTGFLIYGKFMKNREFGSVRLDRLPQMIDLHKFVGVVTFGWSLVVGLSGAFLAFNTLLIKLFQAQSLKHLSAVYKTVRESEVIAPFQQTVLNALTALPQSKISYVSFPDTEFGIPGHFLFLMSGTTPLTERLSQIVVLNAQNGSLTEIVDLPLYLKIVLFSEPLHFGNYGGLFLKILWCAFTLGSLFVVLMGLFSFLLKRRHRRLHAGRQKVSPPIRSPKRLLVLPRWHYAWPTATLITITAGLVLALVMEGWIAQLASALLVLPLALLALKGRWNA